MNARPTKEPLHEEEEPQSGFAQLRSIVFAILSIAASAYFGYHIVSRLMNWILK